MKTKAAVLHEMGVPTPYAETRPLRIEELDLRPPGPGEVVVKLGAAGLCHSDLSVINGSRPRPMPMVLGHEAAGVVVEVGPGVANLRLDDHVIFSFLPMCGRCPDCAGGRPVMCKTGAASNATGEMFGGGRRFVGGDREYNHHLGVSGFSEYTVAAQESLVRITPELPLRTAALFGCAVVTGVGAVLNTAKVAAGTSVAVFGLGGVGLSAVMGAAVAGANPIIAVDTVPHKLALAKAVGATHTIDVSCTDAVEVIRDITRGGALTVVEAVGRAAVLSSAYQATGRGGTTVTVGLPDPKEVLEIQAVGLVGEERTLKGSYMGSAVPRRDLPAYIDLYCAGKLPVDELYTGSLSLSEINEGFDALHRGDAVRQVVEFG